MRLLRPDAVQAAPGFDQAGQAASASLYQASTVKDPGTEKWTTIEPNDGAFSTAGAVALQGDYVLAAGVHYKNPQVIGTLRRYDQGGQWLASDVGWSKAHTAWTKLAWLKTNSFGPTGVAVDAEQNIILVGIGFDNGQPRTYVARFHPDGVLDWELASPAGTEARGVGVQPDGTIYVAGARRTNVNPERWDMEVSVYGPDKTAYGPIAYKDPDDKWNDRSERGRAVAVLKSGRVVIVGTREIVNPNDPNAKFILRGVALLFEGKGKHVGEEWTSSGDKLLYDAIMADVPANADESAKSCATRIMLSVYMAPPTAPHVAAQIQISPGQCVACVKAAPLISSINPPAPINDTTRAIAPTFDKSTNINLSTTTPNKAIPANHHIRSARRLA